MTLCTDIRAAKKFKPKCQSAIQMADVFCKTFSFTVNIDIQRKLIHFFQFALLESKVL